MKVVFFSCTFDDNKIKASKECDDFNEAKIYIFSLLKEILCKTENEDIVNMCRLLKESLNFGIEESGFGEKEHMAYSIVDYCEWNRFHTKMIKRSEKKVGIIEEEISSLKNKLGNI